MSSCYWQGLMVYICIRCIDKDSCYRHGLMVSKTPMVMTWIQGIVSVLLNHTHTRGPSVGRMWDFLLLMSGIQTQSTSVLA